MKSVGSLPCSQQPVTAGSYLVKMSPVPILWLHYLKKNFSVFFSVYAWDFQNICSRLVNNPTYVKF
jgi:hypothetical protein